MDMTKKFGGVITDWTLNTLSFTKEQVADHGIKVKTDKVYILSGTVKSDPTGRFEVGFHFHSSVVIELDKEKGIVETKNTIYHLHGEAGGLGDMGDLIMKVFY